MGRLAARRRLGLVTTAPRRSEARHLRLGVAGMDIEGETFLNTRRHRGARVRTEPFLKMKRCKAASILREDDRCRLRPR